MTATTNRAVDPAERTDHLLALADRVVAQAQPGEQVEAYVSASDRTTVDAYDGDIEALTQASAAGIGIRVIRDQRTGFAWATSFDESAVAEALADARANQPFAEVDEHGDLAEPDGVAVAAVHPHRPGVAATAIDDKIAMALETERRIRTADPRITSVRKVTYADVDGSFAVVSTTGIRASGSRTTAYVAGSALADDGDASVIGYGHSVGREPADVSIDDAVSDTVERVLAKIGSSKPESATVTLVLEPRLTATLFGLISGMLGGERVAKGRSPFADRVGEQIGSPLLTVVDDPRNEESPGADAYDDEGLATRRVPLLAGGVLQGYLHNTRSARKTGSVSTASAARGISSLPGIAARSLTVEPGDGSLESLVAGVDRGVVASTLGGLHSGVNPVSGDFSVSVEGVMVRDGERAEPIKEATLASTLQRLLLDVSHVGADLEWQPGGTGGVTLLIPGVTLSGR